MLQNTSVNIGSGNCLVLLPQLLLFWYSMDYEYITLTVVEKCYWNYLTVMRWYDWQCDNDMINNEFCRNSHDCHDKVLPTFTFIKTLTPYVPTLYTGQVFSHPCACRWPSTWQCKAISRHSADYKLSVFSDVPLAVGAFKRLLSTEMMPVQNCW